MINYLGMAQRDNYGGLKDDSWRTRLEALRQRELALRAKIAEEVKRQQRHQWRTFDRLRTIVGGAAVRIADQNASFKLMLSQAIQSAELTPAERAFLKEQGWL
jgi:hypothetical protein